MKKLQSTENQQVKEQFKLHFEDNLHVMNKLQAVEVLLEVLGLENQGLKVLDSFEIYHKVTRALLECLDYQAITNFVGPDVYEYDDPIYLKIKKLDRSRFMKYEIKTSKY